MLNQDYFDYFQDLSKNNDREWFNANKKRYEKSAKEPFIELVDKIVVALADSEPELSLIPSKQMLFRINRDIRFAKDKRPYKEHLSASIGRFGTKDKLYPGHYFQLGAHESMIAGGAYFFEEKETLLRVRRYIMDNAERFSELINDENFTPDALTLKAMYWDGNPAERRKRLLPFFWNVIGSKEIGRASCRERVCLAV